MAAVMILGLYTWWVLGSSPPAPEKFAGSFAGSGRILPLFYSEGILRMGRCEGEINVEMVFPKSLSSRFSRSWCALGPMEA